MKHCKFAEESFKSSAKQLPGQKPNQTRDDVTSGPNPIRNHPNQLSALEERKAPSNHSNDQNGYSSISNASPNEGPEDDVDSDSLDNFANQADDEFDSSDDDGEKRLGRQHNSLKELMAVEFAKAHKLKIEEDMKVIHERHVKLMREMDLNYKMIEQET
jgi:hypothetical protein